MARIFDYIANKGSLYSETGVLGVVTGGLLHTKCNKGWMLPCTASKYITFTLPSLAQKAIIMVTKVNNTYTVTQTNTTATITSLVLNSANYLRYIIYDSVASATSDLKNIQAWVNILQPLTYQKRLLQLPKPTELKQQGLIAAYNMKPVGNILHDISGNGKNITVPAKIYHSTTRGLKSNNINDGTATYNLVPTNLSATNFSYCLSHDELITAMSTLFYKGGKYIGITAGGILKYFVGSQLDFTPQISATPLSRNGTIIFTYDNTTKVMMVYIDGIYAGQCTFTNPIGTNNFDSILNVGNYAGRQITGVIKDIRIYNRVVTSQEIKAYHNSFNEVILQESFNDMAVGSSKLPNGWIKNGGSFVCGESTTNDAVVKSIRKDTKYLRCVTAGIVAMPCKWVNGTTKINLFKVGNTVNDWLFTSTVIGTFNATGQNGYLLRWDTDNKFKLYKITNGVLSAALITSVNTYPPSWYEPTVTRTTSGVFTVYINGVSIGTATDTTFNTSNYNQHSCIANDRITNINIQSQIKA